MTTPAAESAERFLLRGRTWRYLRYLHLRDFLLPIVNEVETVCVCGAGYGLAELLLAIEFPHLQISLTDITGDGYPMYYRAMDLAWRFEIDNINFSIWNVLTPTKRRFDLVASTEMLEHVKEDERAAANMCMATRRYLYCLVPFADDEANADEKRRQGAWERHRHHVCGYDVKRLASLFPTPCRVAGTYWREHGAVLRQHLSELSLEEIDMKQSELKQHAQCDLLDKVPMTMDECQGIKVLSIV